MSKEKTGTNLAVMEKYDLQVLDTDFGAAAAEELEGLGSLQFDRVKIPSGGVTMFEVPGEDEDNPENVQALTGVILHHHPMNAFWAEAFGGENNSPDCASLDGKQGVVRETGECRACDKCKYNQFGSAENGKGKACKNIHRLYILREGDPVPLILALPPTSLKALKDYLGKTVLLKAKRRSYEVVTKITLKKDKNENNITYSKAVFALAGTLTEEQAASTRAMRDAVIAMANMVDIDEEDYSAEPAKPAAPQANDDGFVNIPDSVEDEGLPFN